MKFEQAVLLAEERNYPGFDEFSVILGEDEGDHIPHIHITKDSKTVCVRLDMPFYFKHGNKKYVFNSSSKKMFVLYMNEKPIKEKIILNEDGSFPKNNWENFRNTWNIMHPEYKINSKVIPNYKTLNKDYKEK